MSLLLSLLDRVFALLSWERAQGLGAFLGGATRHLGRRRWRMTLANLAAAFPEKSAAEREAIGREAWENAGRLAAEFIKSRSMPLAELERVVLFENLDLVEALHKEGRGILFNIGHLGNWEVGGVAFTARGIKLGVIGRVMKDPAVDRWVTETRSRFGESVIGHRNPFFAAVKWLKKGNGLAILIDHNLYEGGIFVPFFGRPAATSTLSALLAIKLGCPIVHVRVRRDGRRLIVSFHGPLRPEPGADPELETVRLTREMTAALEGFIRQRPGDWLWGHNRWKRQPEAGDRR